MQIEFKRSFFISLFLLSAIAALSFGMARGVLAGAIITASLYLHEFAHALMWVRGGVRVNAVGVSAMGGYTTREGSGKWVTQAQSAISGPLVNLALAWMFLRMPGSYNHWLGNANFVLAVSNLLPFPGSDGYRLWNALLVPLTRSRPKHR